MRNMGASLKEGALMLRTESTAVHETYLALAAAAAACAINFWARDLGHCYRFTTGSSIEDKSAAPAPDRGTQMFKRPKPRP